MTVRCFHVDRLQSLSPGQTLTLGHEYHITDDQPITVAEEQKQVIDRFYPEGISRHGARYLFGYQPTQTYFAEVAFELIRRIEFPDKQSRFQSLFGFESIEVAKTWAQETAIQDTIETTTATVWEVEAAVATKRDRTHLCAAPFAEMVTRAEAYWSGDQSLHQTWELVLEPPVHVRERVTEVSV